MAKLTIIRILLLILAYVISGRLSLLLAIPPGFTTAIFLPVGIAMGAVLIWGKWLLPGVFLGSTLLNVIQASAHGFSWSSLLLASEIALGSTLAVALGNFLVKKVVRFPSTLDDERQIFWFLFLSGPVATLVSGLLGPLALYSNGIIPANYIAYSAWTWWAGDSIGILLGAPLMFVLFAEPRSVWAQRIKPVGIPVVLSSLLVVLVFVRSSDQEQGALIGHFHQQARLMSADLKNSLNDSQETLQGVRGLFLASREVTREDFKRYVTNINIQKLGISALSWNPWVTSAEREAFVKRLRAQGFSEFDIRQPDAEGQLVISPAQESYVVIEYIEPWQRHKQVLGLNVYSEASRHLALDEALAANKTRMTEPITLIQEQRDSKANLLFLPVWINQDGGNARRVLGFVTAVLRAEDYIRSALEDFDAKSYFLTIADVTHSSTKEPVFSNFPEQLTPQQQALTWTESLEFGGRKLELKIAPSDSFIARNTSQHSWYVFAGGLLFTSLLGAFLLLISGKTENVKNLVEERTHEISAILNNAFEAILIVDASGKLLRANPAAARLFEYSLDHLVSLKIQRLLPDLSPRFSREESDLTPMHALQTRGISSTGQEINLELSLSHQLLRGANVFTLIIHDISERAKVDKLKREFISTISHELRTPLTSIKGSLSLCMSGATGTLSASTEKMLNIASTNADRLVRLINDILDIDKLEFSHVTFNMAPHPVYEYLELSVEQCAAYAEKYGVQLTLETNTPSAHRFLANIDPDRFLQVMFNLLSNAIKYSEPGGQVEIRLTKLATNQLQISVRDWGAGIPEEFHNRIFQKFAQADSSDSRRREGTGLGLSITKIIVERFGGQIDFESRPGAGTEFRVTLPSSSRLVNPTD